MESSPVFSSKGNKWTPLDSSSSPLKSTDDKKKAALARAKAARESFQKSNPNARFNKKTSQPTKAKTEIKTAVKGDKEGGGYSAEQKKRAVSSAMRNKALKDRSKRQAAGYDVNRANRNFRKNTLMGKSLTRQGHTRRT